MELHTGYISWKELAEWFGLSYNTVIKYGKNAKEKKLQKLAGFADFHRQGNRIIIDNVRIPTYSKALDIIENKFLDYWGKYYDKNGDLIEPLNKKRIDTSTSVGRRIWNEHSEVKSHISERISGQCAGSTKIKFYGHNALDDYGTMGRCESVWMNREGTDILSGEDEKKFLECIQEVYSKKNIDLAGLDADFQSGLINEEEYFQAYLQYHSNKFLLLRNKCIDEMGFMPDRRTQIYEGIRN